MIRRCDVQPLFAYYRHDKIRWAGPPPPRMDGWPEARRAPPIPPSRLATASARHDAAAPTEGGEGETRYGASAPALVTMSPLIQKGETRKSETLRERRDSEVRSAQSIRDKEHPSASRPKQSSRARSGHAPVTNWSRPAITQPPPAVRRAHPQPPRTGRRPVKSVMSRSHPIHHVPILVTPRSRPIRHV